MKAEEIMRALHLTAMGRVNTPEQQRLCEALAGLLETAHERAEREMAAQPVPRRWVAHSSEELAALLGVETVKEPAKRARKKAE